ncbi:MAG: SGNH/GDSL hydrolase family protein [Acidobacteria bacterium]|nr:SGNH/GDSL hydrolase family protein [Acidobacteriota bacterium]
MFKFPTFYLTDGARGFALRPGAEGWYRKEGESYVRINSEGLRDREHAKQKPPGTLRVAVVGDSYAEALQVEQRDAFWAVAERELRQCPALAGREVEAVNFGVSGYGTAQELLTVRQHVFQYSPDIVLLAFTTNNDITDNSRALKRADEMPYFTLRDGRLALDDSFCGSRSFRLRHSAPGRAAAWLRDNSRALQAFHQAQYALKNYLARRRARQSAPPAQPRPDARPAPPEARATRPAPAATPALDPDEVGVDNLVYRDPLDATWEDAWRVTEALLVAMRDEVEGRGARFYVATLSNGIQVHPAPAAREAFMRRVGATDLFYPDKRVAALGARERFAVFTLAPELQADAEARRIFLHGFGPELGNGHWNVEGHRAAGRLLAQKLCAELSK